MPADFILDEPHRVVFSRSLGDFTYLDYRDHMARLASDPRFRPEFDQLVDCRSSQLVLSSDQVRDLASQSVFSDRSKRAFVVSSNFQFGLSRMWANYREVKAGQAIMVFREMSEALAWLRLPADMDPFAAGKPASGPQKPDSTPEGYISDTTAI